MNAVSVITGAVVAICVVAGVVVLGIHGTLDGQTVAAIFGAIIGGGSVAAHAAASK